MGGGRAVLDVLGWRLGYLGEGLFEGDGWLVFFVGCCSWVVFWVVLCDEGSRAWLRLVGIGLEAAGSRGFLVGG